MAEPIPKCDYLIRKGGIPADDRSNIFAWTPQLAERTDDFEEYRGALPRRIKPTTPEPEEVTIPVEDAKKILLMETIDKLDNDEFTAGEVPRIDALTRILGVPITKEERDEAHEAWLKREEEKEG